jgi:hypothetical protein
MLILFDKDTAFEDVNSVKVNLKAFKDQFDNKNNYD